MFAMTLNTVPLHARFGVEVLNIDLRTVTANNDYPEIRHAFETHSLLLFRNQTLSGKAHLTFSELFGIIENRAEDAWGKRPTEPGLLSNVNDKNSFVSKSDRCLAHLKSNQLWHTDSTFLPVPALTNILTALVVPSTGGETQFTSTRAALNDIPEALQSKVFDITLRHRYAHSRAKIDPELAKEEMITRWPDQRWKAIWPNPVNGELALYIASHVCGVEGMDDESGIALVDELMTWATQQHYIYTHHWQVGDVLVWDERATLHRGCHWPYDEERTLASVCVSAGEEDGLNSIRPL